MGYFRKNIEEIAGYTPGYQPSNSDIIKLNTNENPYPPSKRVMEAIARVRPDQLRMYPKPFLGDTFREAASKVLGVGMDNIICTNGGDDMLTIAIRSFCDEEHPLAFPGPTYSLYPILAAIQNCKVVEVPFGENYSLCSDELVETNAGLIIVCNPNAPTGSFISPTEIKGLADRVKGKSMLLVDEAYVDFAEENCLGLVKSCENVILLRSMSKGYSLAGLRFGFGIAPEPVIEGLRKVKDSYNVDAIAIAAATAAMEDQEYFKANVEKVKAQRKIVTDELRNLGFDVPESKTNFVFAKCVECDAEDIYNKLAKRNIFVRYFKIGGITDKLRITIGTEEQNNKLITELKNILNK